MNLENVKVGMKFNDFIDGGVIEITSISSGEINYIDEQGTEIFVDENDFEKALFNDDIELVHE